MATLPLTENRTSAGSPAGMRPGPVFVVGMWRSGTSLLYALLNQHPEIALMYEGELPVLRPLFVMPGGKEDWAERWNFWNGAVDRHRIDPAKVPSTARDLSTAMQAVYKTHTAHKGATVWGCKSPNYYDFLTRLARTFPQSQFIVIWRDPADVCRSIIRAAEKDTWFSKRGILHRALFGLRRMKRECDRLIRSGVSVHQIEFEDLVHRPAEVMVGICRFLDIPYDPRMTTLKGADRSAIYEGDHHAAVKSEKIVGRKDRQEVLSAELQRKIQRYALYWRRESGDTWPPVSGILDAGQGTPGVIERIKDRLVFRALRTLDATVVFIYCFAPLSLLKMYRTAKARSQEAGSAGEDEQVRPVSAD